jgi:hypothetical protein
MASTRPTMTSVQWSVSGHRRILRADVERLIEEKEAGPVLTGQWAADPMSPQAPNSPPDPGPGPCESIRAGSRIIT